MNTKIDMGESLWKIVKTKNSLKASNKLYFRFKYYSNYI